MSGIIRTFAIRMIELAKHIEILLLDNDCVIVPDFGGFMAHHVDAVYDTEEGLFLPPRRTLGFNPQLYINDSLLAQSYVEAYDISYPDAVNRIESEVREIRQILDYEGYYELPDIGVISKNEDGNYEFEPCPSGILTPSIYALSSFEMPLLSVRTSLSESSNDKENAIRNVGRKVRTRKKWSGIIGIPKANRTYRLESRETANKNTAIVLSMEAGLLRNVVAVAAIVILFVFSSLPFGEAVPTTVQQCSMDSNILSSVLPSTKVSNDEDVRMVKVVNNSVVNIERSAKEDSVMQDCSEYESKESYVIVFASKVTRKNAEMLAEKLKQDGMDDARVVEQKGGNRVVAGCYGSEQEAYLASKSLRDKSLQYQDVWIMKLD